MTVAIDLMNWRVAAIALAMRTNSNAALQTASVLTCLGCVMAKTIVPTALMSTIQKIRNSASSGHAAAKNCLARMASVSPNAGNVTKKTIVATIRTSRIVVSCPF